MTLRAAMVATLVLAAGARAGVAVRVEASTLRASVVDVVTLDIVVTAPASAEVTFDPPLEEALEAAGWTVRGVTAEPARYDPGEGVAWRVVRARVEPFLDGAYTVPPLRVIADGAEATSEALTIEVVSLLRADDPTPVETLATPRGVLTPQGERSLWVAAGWGIAAALLIGASWAGLSVTRKRGARRVPDDVVAAAHDARGIARALRDALNEAGVSHATSRTAEELSRGSAQGAASLAIAALAEVDEARFAGDTVPEDLLARAAEATRRLRAEGAGA